MYHKYIIYLLALRSSKESKVAMKQSPPFRPMFPQTGSKTSEFPLPQRRDSGEILMGNSWDPFFMGI